MIKDRKLKSVILIITMTILMILNITNISNAKDHGKNVNVDIDKIEVRR